MRLVRRDKGRFEAYCFEVLSDDWVECNSGRCLICGGSANWLLEPLSEVYCGIHKELSRLVWLRADHELSVRADRKEWRTGYKSKRQRIAEAEERIVALGEANQEQIMEVLNSLRLTLAEWMSGRKRFAGRSSEPVKKLNIDMNISQLEQKLTAKKAEESYYIEAAAWEVLEGRDIAEVAEEFEISEEELRLKVEELRQKGGGGE